MSLPRVPAPAFRHEALFYVGNQEFLDGTLPFIRSGLARGDAVLVVVDHAKIALLRAALGGDAERVEFADMAAVGRNPARIIPHWQEFVDDHQRDGRGACAIGETCHPGRSAAEAVECQVHETLVNVAFGNGPAWSLLCPFDVGALAPDVVAQARRSHPAILRAGVSRPSGEYRDAHEPHAHLDHPLPPSPEDAFALSFDAGHDNLAKIRVFVRDHAGRCGLSPTAVEELTLAADELVANSMIHGGGSGTIRLWRDGGSLVCEVQDAGKLAPDPLLGRRRPTTGQIGGRGLWMVNQLCDLVQIRRTPDGTVIRLHHVLTRQDQVSDAQAAKSPAS